MAKIRVLPESVANKIAAGEVVERPASVVKELMENALDAGATDIRVETEDGGRRLIRVVDNGSGLEAEDLPLALASHATSKLASADDLFAIETMGFRGEALASIASVSRLRITSRPAGSIEGARIESIGGKITGPEPAASPVGTTVEVRDLFFNVPARRKFLRSAQTEFAHIAEAFVRIALARPDLRLTLVHNRRTIHELLPTEDRRQRIAELFGQDIAEILIHGKSEEDSPVSLEVFASPPSFDRGNAKLQYLFLNDRFIRDRSIAHAIGQAYQGLLTVNRYPVVFLFLTCPPSLFDVNVHPTKTEVRFRDSRPVYNAVQTTLRRILLEQDLFPDFPSGGETAPSPAPSDAEASGDGSSGAEPPDWTEDVSTRKGRILSNIADYVQRRRDASQPFSGPAPSDRFSSKSDRSSTPATSATGRPMQGPPGPAKETDDVFPPPAPGPSGTTKPAVLFEDRGELQSATEGRTRSGRRFFQIHNAYILLETDDGFALIDQHALHERILLERLTAEAEKAGVRKHRLLAPATVRLTPAEFALAMELREALKKIGLEIDEFGPNTVAIQTTPYLVRQASPEEILRDALEACREGLKLSGLEFRKRLLEIAACRAAVKAGDPLKPAEIEALIDQWRRLENRQTCAHGRPLAIHFTLKEIEKRFRRT